MQDRTLNHSISSSASSFLAEVVVGMDQKRWQENGTNQSFTSPGFGAAYAGGICPSGHLSSPWDFHHSLHDPICTPAAEPGSFTSVVSSAKESSANSQPIIPKRRMPEDLIFMAVEMSCALQNTLQKRRERLGRDSSSQGHRLP